MTQKRFQILSLDGGGIKGLFSAAFLSKLEDDLNIRISDYFDLIVGTSTGGIIALGLGLGFSPKKMVEFYFEKGPIIFKKPFASWVKHWILGKYSDKPIEAVFREASLFGEKLLSESKKRLVVPSYNIDSGDVHLFKTAHHSRLNRDHNVPMWKIARATSAAPSFFPICKCVDNIRLVDGGVWANNPATVGLFEALTVLEIPQEAVRILSIGTTEELRHSKRRLDIFRGKLFWSTTAIELIMQAQSVSINAQLKLLLKNRFERIDPKVPEGLFGLDKMNLKELFGFASEYSRTFSPIFVKTFQDHKADEFIPANK